jgi:hypothetical protein
MVITPGHFFFERASRAPKKTWALSEDLRDQRSVWASSLRAGFGMPSPPRRRPAGTSIADALCRRSLERAATGRRNDGAHQELDVRPVESDGQRSPTGASRGDESLVLRFSAVRRQPRRDRHPRFRLRPGRSRWGRRSRRSRGQDGAGGKDGNTGDCGSWSSSAGAMGTAGAGGVPGTAGHSGSTGTGAAGGSSGGCACAVCGSEATWPLTAFWSLVVLAVLRRWRQLPRSFS